MAKEDNSKYEELRNYVWNYFQYHGSQRLATFHYYILISSLIASGYFLAVKSFPVLGIVLGILLMLLSFVFWNLDCRNRQALNISIDALEYIENQELAGESEETRNKLNIMTRDLRLTQELRAKKIFGFWSQPLHYSACMNIIYSSFSVFGLVAVVFAVISLF